MLEKTRRIIIGYKFNKERISMVAMKICGVNAVKT
jgi:hypothetical protein